MRTSKALSTLLLAGTALLCAALAAPHATRPVASARAGHVALADGTGTVAPAATVTPDDDENPAS